MVFGGFLQRRTSLEQDLGRIQVYLDALSSWLWQKGEPLKFFALEISLLVLIAVVPFVTLLRFGLAEAVTEG